MLELFIRESNKIEGIHRPPTDAEITAAKEFIRFPKIGLADVVRFVDVCEPGAVLREKPGQNVRVGDHIAPPGGPDIQDRLWFILDKINRCADHPLNLHREYETLHPFTDGNGRSGRMLWAWQMLHYNYQPGLQLGFLHAWYYQSLQAPRTTDEEQRDG